MKNFNSLVRVSVFYILGIFMKLPVVTSADFTGCESLVLILNKIFSYDPLSESCRTSES